MIEAPHPQSIICTPSGREVQLKVHQCIWSGAYPGNSLAAVQECFQAHAARAEIDVTMLKDADFLVVHDLDLARATDGTGYVDQTTRLAASRLHLKQGGAPTSTRVTLLSDVVAVVAQESYPTRLELDLKDWNPWPWPRVEELALLLQPIKGRITFGGGADWNLRRLLVVDPTLPMGFTISDYLDWLPVGRESGGLPGVRGAYGYLDRHPLARVELGTTADYLRDRIGAIVRLVPGARDIHIRLLAVERMLDDGLTDLAELLHAQNMLLVACQGSIAYSGMTSGKVVAHEGVPREVVRGGAGAIARVAV